MSTAAERVLVTGANGFVGTVLADMLARAGFIVRSAVRGNREPPAGTAETTIVGNIDGSTDWGAALEDVDLVIHTAARAHIARDTGDPSIYIATNADGTRRLAEASAQAGIRRLVFLSSIKVNGEETGDHAYSASSVPRPSDAYAKSKWRAELSLAETAARTGLQTVIVRPPLVYGPGVRANFYRLIRWVEHGFPLPFASVENSRSFVSVWNLCDLLIVTLRNPAASGRVWMVSDGHDLSTPEMIRKIAGSMGRNAALVSVPVTLLRLMGRMSGQDAAVARLCGSLKIDISETSRELAWSPPMTVEHALSRTIEWYRRSCDSGPKANA
jgi:nucleoside-diphosphate-sugar epimerase